MQSAIQYIKLWIRWGKPFIFCRDAVPMLGSLIDSIGFVIFKLIIYGHLVGTQHKKKYCLGSCFTVSAHQLTTATFGVLRSHAHVHFLVCWDLYYHHWHV